MCHIRSTAEMGNDTEVETIQIGKDNLHNLPRFSEDGNMGRVWVVRVGGDDGEL